ncbi:hypothetical protein PGT21_000146 [Puccinia graminis f. sp. tritici]|uniref:Uncharacterized protein n=1 Tax=Puccinia graminis f. sp. tritici TaxID=56615 RepID=A0A5B0MEX3_PUCGR|nr:hypothetical protein PGT21_000146 [Puccinia graminis f. sp. tritici]
MGSNSLIKITRINQEILPASLTSDDFPLGKTPLKCRQTKFSLRSGLQNLLAKTTNDTVERLAWAADIVREGFEAPYRAYDSISSYQR